jgi:hypothetical protein
MDDLKIVVGFFGGLTWMFCQVMFAALVYVPFLVTRKIWRWYRLPQRKRDAINANQRVAIEYGWHQVETLIQAELLAHGLTDTPEHRARLKSTRLRLRGR